MRTLATVVVLGVVASQAALAQSTAASQETGRAMMTACKTDYRAHCTGNNPSPPIAAACLSQHYISLSRGCQAALDAYNNPGQGNEDEQN